MMINDIKLGMKMMRYGHMFKMNIFLSVVYLVGGSVIAIGLDNVSGGLFFIVAGMMPGQIICSLNTSSMVLTSPARKKMQTTIPTVLSCLGMFSMYIVVDLLFLIKACIFPYWFPAVCKAIVLMLVFAVLTMIYMPIACKYMAVSTFVYVIIVILLYTGANMYMPMVDSLAFFNKGISSFVLISALGLFVIAVGGFLEYLLSLLVYKAPVSKYSQSVYLRKEL